MFEKFRDFALRLGDMHNASRCVLVRVLELGLLDQFPNLASKLMMSSTRFSSGDLQNNRVEMLIVAGAVALEHRLDLC